MALTLSGNIKHGSYLHPYPMYSLFHVLSTLLVKSCMTCDVCVTCKHCLSTFIIITKGPI
ncbi:hypothetical protein Sjap_007480 [Stephania japonica]|uniref:Uncharacterized protein n=1 Tax=Stephania japonica TaxID=461633 RepID=A0AAP0PDK8_9MAGN